MVDKPRKPWISVVLTLLAVGLGHIYTGAAKKGITLYFLGQGIILLIFLPLIYFIPSAIVLLLAGLCVILFVIYCIVDAIKIARQNRVSYDLKRYNKWYIYFTCLVVASFVVQPLVGGLIKVFFIQAYKIPAGSLKPTLLIGDHILSRKLFAAIAGYKRGDMVIFPFPEDTSKSFIKRVIATAGETIEIVDKKVYIDGEFLEEPYVIFVDPQIYPEGQHQRDNYGPVLVPGDTLFVMGDNRDQSYDSRFWGFVEKTAIEGKAYAIYWSWDKENAKVRWNRIGQRIK